MPRRLKPELLVEGRRGRRLSERASIKVPKLGSSGHGSSEGSALSGIVKLVSERVPKNEWPIGAIELQNEIEDLLGKMKDDLLVIAQSLKSPQGQAFVSGPAAEPGMADAEERKVLAQLVMAASRYLPRTAWPVDQDEFMSMVSTMFGSGFADVEKPAKKIKAANGTPFYSEEIGEEVVGRLKARQLQEARWSIDDDIDIVDLIEFADVWGGLGDAVQEQVRDLLDDPEADVNSNAVKLAKRKLLGWHPDLDSALNDWTGPKDDKD